MLSSGLPPVLCSLLGDVSLGSFGYGFGYSFGYIQLVWNSPAWRGQEEELPQHTALLLEGEGRAR